ncbi:MAG: beta-galactosidase, partial [Gemmatimonadota bacterium]|nr:beta-galactosidase [Gemmatimonadota bacterium]
MIGTSEDWKVWRPARSALEFALLTLFAALNTAGAQRVEYTINSGWRYLSGGVNLAEKPGNSDDGWERVSIPHTWNASDPFDDTPSYRRGIGWYRKHLSLGEELRGKRVFLHFEGVNQVADVYVNNAFAGRHKGGYTAFTVDVTKFLKLGAGADNLVAVQVNNAHDPFIPPLSVGFALYGGIYRDVWLVATDAVHLSMADGSDGVRVTTDTVSREMGVVSVEGTVQNDGASSLRIEMVSTILDASGKKVAEQRTASEVALGSTRLKLTFPAVSAPHLWSPDDPYLYSVRTELYDGAKLLDGVTSPLGFRWYRFDGSG